MTTSQDLISHQMAEAHKDRPPMRLLSLLTSAQRKEYPMATGLLDYFPDALAMVSHVSWLGNQKHNPGKPMHWSRAKSGDHPDCEVRHLVERGYEDQDGIMHSAEKVWRALADLQLELETKFHLDPPRGADDTGRDTGRLKKDGEGRNGLKKPSGPLSGL